VSQTASIWLVIVAAFLAANLPFLLDRRVLAVWPLKASKGIGVRLAELVAWYFIVGGLGVALENRVGQIAPQRWEFYAITGALFLTFAFPGFVWRYLGKHRRG
jgi:hypothetical protein